MRCAASLPEMRAGGTPTPGVVPQPASTTLSSPRTRFLGRNGPVPRTAREPLVRTVHSYAYGLLRLRAAADGTPAPRLLAGAEQDVVMRELLAGDLESGAPDWPEGLRPALAVPGFAHDSVDAARGDDLVARLDVVLHRSVSALAAA